MTKDNKKAEAKNEALEKTRKDAIERLKKSKNFILFTGEQMNVRDTGVAANLQCIASTTNVVRLAAFQDLLSDITKDAFGERMLLEVLKKYVVERIIR